MNILMLSTHFNTGGITSYVFTLAKGLQSKGHKVFVVTSGGNMIPELILLGVHHTTINIQTKSELSLKIYFSLNQLARFVKEYKIDIIHSQTRVTQVIGTLLSQITGKPCVSTCHGFFKKRLSRQLIPCWGDAVIAISEAVKDHLKKDFKVDEKKIALIHNGVDAADFPPMDDELKKIKKHKLSLKSGPVIGIIARLSDVKGHDVLIHAMRDVVHEYTDACLLIVGEGKMERSLRELVQKLNLEDHVRFCPTVGKTTEFLPLFDIFVMPSLQEGLGLSVMEAQAAGLPVVASNIGGIPSLIEDGKTGLLVPPGYAKGLAQAIISLLNDRDKAKEIGAAGRKFIQKEFSADNMVNETVELYQDVLKKRCTKKS